MRTMMTIVTLVAVVFGLAFGQSTQPAEVVTGVESGVVATRPAVEVRVPLIQIGLLLDTSNSMDGLIDQAKTQLWKIVNEFIPARRDGLRPELQVALYEYGNNGLRAKTGFIRQVCPLTTDLDRVSQELFALKTNGGEEFCGQVIQRATQNLTWSAAGNDYKAIFIAGNEPFTQGPVLYQEACKAAISKGILVNTIFCGSQAEGVNTGWKDGAVLADGSYSFINQNERMVHIAAPQDAEIARLGVELNETYIAYGSKGTENQMRQQAQDSNASMSALGAAVQRAVTKGSANYRNSSWDLLDATKEGVVKLDEIKDDDLPETMRGMTPEQRKEHLEKLGVRRAEIQKRIATLDEQRKAHVAEEMKKLAAGGKNTLDEAIGRIVKEQASKRQFVFEKP